MGCAKPNALPSSFVEKRATLGERPLPSDPDWRLSSRIRGARIDCDSHGLACRSSDKCLSHLARCEEG